MGLEGNHSNLTLPFFGLFFCVVLQRATSTQQNKHRKTLVLEFFNLV